MNNTRLITAQAVKDNGYVHDNVLPGTIEVTIDRVQRTMLRKVMDGVKGKGYYEEFLDKVDNSPLAVPTPPSPVPLSAYDQELLDDYIQPYLVTCVDYKILFPSNWRVRAKSVGKGQDANHTPVDIKELVMLKDQMKQDSSDYAEDLRDKLREEDNSCETTQQTTPWQSLKFR